MTPEDYLAGNLLGHEVKAEDVARSFLHLALSLKTTADDGSITYGTTKKSGSLRFMTRKSRALGMPL